jgi:hypothetical protein
MARLLQKKCAEQTAENIKAVFALAAKPKFLTVFSKR